MRCAKARPGFWSIRSGLTKLPLPYASCSTTGCWRSASEAMGGGLSRLTTIGSGLRTTLLAWGTNWRALGGRVFRTHTDRVGGTVEDVGAVDRRPALHRRQHFGLAPGIELEDLGGLHDAGSATHAAILIHLHP